MNIQDLGSVGELVAAIATVGTLIYLAVQLSRNTQSLRSSTLQEIQRDVRAVLLSSPEATELAARYRDGEALATGERTFLVQRFMSVFRVMETIWYQVDRGTLDKVLLNGYMHHMRVVMSTDLAREVWEGYQVGVFHPGFVAFANDYLEKNPPIQPKVLQGVA